MKKKSLKCLLCLQLYQFLMVLGLVYGYPRIIEQHVPTEESTNAVQEQQYLYYGGNEEIKGLEAYSQQENNVESKGYNQEAGKDLAHVIDYYVSFQI